MPQRPGRTPVRRLNVRPDRIDFRDLAFRPDIALAPKPTLFPEHALRVKSQADTNACTGFALSLVVEHLLLRSKREKSPNVSPYMAYSMARRYDEFPGSRDEGSSLRAALRGWHKHGVCADQLWRTGVKMPRAPRRAADDWWLDAVKRPLGAYYRIEKKQIADLHAALNEVGIVYASTDTHGGWDEGANGGGQGRWRQRPNSFAEKIFRIPSRPGGAGGHAVALVGYNEHGFLLQNSWDSAWGSHGYAILGYEDWLENAMDAWVAQLGVVTQERADIARSNTLRADARGRVSLASSTDLRNREISPFVVDVGNDGRLSSSGLFRTSDDDLRSLVQVHMAEARRRWGLGSRPLDVCLYAHGGLVNEDSAADSAAAWIPRLYENRIFPIYLMWETGLLATVVNRIVDAVRDVPRPASAGPGFWSSAERWWNERVERLLAKPGTELWGELKQNAHAISHGPDSGGMRLWSQLAKLDRVKHPVRLHLVGHSAGSVVHAHLIEALAAVTGFESVSFLAPSLRLDRFDALLRPRLGDGTIARYQQFHLTEKAEQDDPTCGPYRRSLLYLVSESFEAGARTPILGLQKYFDPYRAKLANTTVHVAPGATSTSSTHPGFDDDPATQRRVVGFIQGA